MDSPACGTMTGRCRSGHVARPRTTPSFDFPYRGQMLEIEIGLDRVEYALREGERLVIRHEMEEVELTRENPLVVRPVSRR